MISRTGRATPFFNPSRVLALSSPAGSARAPLRFDSKPAQAMHVAPPGEPPARVRFPEATAPITGVAPSRDGSHTLV